MHSGRITGATRHLSAPQGWDKERQGVCVGLAVRDDDTSAGHGMTSAWFPTPAEIERIARGAPIYLTIIGDVHPPVAMGVGATPDSR